MAEGLTNALHGEDWVAYSAGTEPGSVHPLAIAALAELDIDISHHRSKHLREFLGREMDVVVTVCNSAQEACPFFSGGKRQIHRSFIDPSSVEGTDQQRFRAFATLRDEMIEWLEGFLRESKGNAPTNIGVKFSP